MTRRYDADPAAAGQRADAVLAEALGLTRSAVQKLCDEGRVFCGGLPIKKNRRVSAGEQYAVDIPQPRAAVLRPLELTLDVVYEDADIIVVNKPRGLVVHPAAGHADDTLANALLSHCGTSLSGINGELRPGIVHRLDKDTSGLIVAAKNDAAHLSLAAQIKAHTARRAYEAVVRGVLREDTGRVDAPIGRDPKNRKKMAVVSQNSRPAATNWEVLERYPGWTHVRCVLETGRTHQIRVHMAHIGHPVAGDPLYGGRDELHIGGQCLHARRLSLNHPRTGERMDFECALPEYFVEVLTKLSLRI